MIRHYLKVAFRNLLKYKTQNIISIIGLAVGLLCFCICMYCSRFVETTNHCFSNYTRIVELNLYDYQTEHIFRYTSGFIRRTPHMGNGRGGSNFLYDILA